MTINPRTASQDLPSLPSIRIPLPAKPRVEIPLVDSPIRGYMMYSYHLAVTFASVPAWPWFFGNFVQLQCDSRQLELGDFLKYSSMPKGELHFTEGTSRFNPWLADAPGFDKQSFLGGYGSPSERVVERLEQGYCVETFVDEYYIPVLYNGGNLHFRHRLLVFGCQEEERRLHIAGFDKKSQYSRLICTFEEFDDAFASVQPQQFEKTRLFKPRQDVFPAPGFDPLRLIHLLRDYLGGRNTLLSPDLHGSGQEGDSFRYGVDCYSFLAEFIQRIAVRRQAGEFLGVDFRGFHVLWEHKKCMLDRLKWLQRQDYDLPDRLIAEYGRVQSLCEQARSRVVMCARGLLPPDRGHLVEVPRYLEQARAAEVPILQRVLEILEAASTSPAA